MDEIDDLRRQILGVMNVPDATRRSWSASVERLDREFQQIAHRHDGEPIDLGEYDVRKIVSAFRVSAKISSRREFIQVTRVAGIRLPDGWCVMGSAPHVRVLRTYVESITSPRQMLNALRELLLPYLSFVPSANGEMFQPSADFTRIIRFLYVAISKAERFDSLWFSGFQDHKSILSDNPAERYLQALVAGRTIEIDALFQQLSIPADSWFIRWMLRSLMTTLANQQDEHFKRGLDTALSWMQQQQALSKNVNAQVDAVAIALSRYAMCKHMNEHSALQKLSVRLIGNPWVDANQWAALVRKDGRPDENARKMVDGWLKRTLINDFYSILQQDNATDHNRLKYWLRFKDHIEDMWFALDEPVYDSKRQIYVDFRERAYGRLSILEKGNGASAFVMLIGGYYMVEFSQTNNRCFVYRKAVLESLVGKDFFSRTDASRVSMKQLKDMERSTLRQSHNGDWFRHFDEKFEQIIPRVMACLPLTR